MFYYRTVYDIKKLALYDFSIKMPAQLLKTPTVPISL